MRDTLFVSHANPEDNEFSLWLTLQLAKEGYPVWCDLTRLLGGEDFWKDIEKNIRERTIKFIYVLSRVSNNKEGSLQELHVAKNVSRDSKLNDFIIPLIIDDLPPRDINIEISRINAIPFNQGWARGLGTLIEKLEAEAVPKSSKFNPDAVTSWWRSNFSAEKGVHEESEDYLSNWFMIEGLPETIYFHTLRNHKDTERIAELLESFIYPAFQHNHNLVSFAQADDFRETDLSFTSVNIPYQTKDFMDNKAPRFLDKKQGRDFIYRLLRIAWERTIAKYGLLQYTLANEAKMFFFPKGLVEGDKLFFTGVTGARAWRNIVGHSEKYERYWHFGIEAKPLVHPCLAYIIKPHVVFSDDGRKIWENKSQLHKARRSACKNWWNSEWRDRITATMTFLAGDTGKMALPLGSSASIHVSGSPVAFKSPVSYAEPNESDQSSKNVDEEWELEDGEDAEGTEE